MYTYFVIIIMLPLIPLRWLIGLLLDTLSGLRGPLSGLIPSWGPLGGLMRPLRRFKNKSVKIFKIVWYTIYITRQLIWIHILQYLNNTVKKVGKNSYEISYVINGKLYKLITSTKRGPSPVLQIVSKTDDDVTALILPYMGPLYDCHNMDITPAMLGHESLLFELGNGTEYTYMEHDKINLKILNMS